MSEITKQDLNDLEARLGDKLRESTERVLEAVLNEMGTRFGEVNGRLDRIDATLQMQAKELAGGARAIAGLIEWTSKTDADYTSVLLELANVKLRLSKLEQAS